MKSITERLRRGFRSQGAMIFASLTVLMAAALVAQQPMQAVASTNPGLDSGNAQVTTVGSDTVLQYKTTGTSTFKAPGGVSNMRVLVIGGGGGGGSNGGGGGAGRMVAASSVAVTPGVSQTITVGGGGTGVTTNASQGGDGGASSIGSIAVAPGGGGGGSSASKTDPNGSGRNGSRHRSA